MAFSISPQHVFQRFITLQPDHWQRRRGSLGPPQVMLSLMAMTVLGCQGYERTLHELKLRLGRTLGWESDDDVPTASALCQARRKLDASRCAAVVSDVRALCTSARTQASLGYGGLRIVALDGTHLALPAYAALRTHFGCPSQGPDRPLAGPQAALLVAWDVGANQPIDWRLGPYSSSEQVHAQELAKSLGPGDLVLGDRNFPSRRFLGVLRLRKAHVLMRVRMRGRGAMREVAAFVASGVSEAVVSITMSTTKESAYTGDVRLLRAALPDGTEAVYLTTLLEAERHPAPSLIALYAQRWRIETAFREMKIWHGLERFHARHVEGIAQEVAAIMIFQLLASELEAQAREQYPTARIPTARKEQPNELLLPQVRFNRRIVADSVVDLLAAAARGGNLVETFRYAFFRIWRYRQTPRPNRSFPRLRKSPPRGWKQRGTKGKGRP